VNLLKAFEDRKCNSPVSIGQLVAIFAQSPVEKRQAATGRFSKGFLENPGYVCDQYGKDGIKFKREKYTNSLQKFLVLSGKKLTKSLEN
jgi:hypothetical protein